MQELEAKHGVLLECSGYRWLCGVRADGVLSGGRHLKEVYPDKAIHEHSNAGLGVLQTPWNELIVLLWVDVGRAHLVFRRLDVGDCWYVSHTDGDNGTLSFEEMWACRIPI